VGDELPPRAVEARLTRLSGPVRERYCNRIVTDLYTPLRAALAGRYDLIRELGRGGMAIVYLARDLKHERPVAIKVLRPELGSTLGVDRFLQEIRFAARLQHPHILGVIDSDRFEVGPGVETPFYIMPYAEGESLRQRLERERRLPVDAALAVAGQVGAALAHAHSHGIVHRDIKPGNILLEGGQAVVADFGIARAITLAGGERQTETGLVLGTPAYMSPEQAAGASDLDGRMDIYALGCVVYEMLSGAPPFTAPTAPGVLAQHAIRSARPLRQLRPEVPEAVEHAVARALAKIPDERFATATEFTEALLGAGALGSGSNSLARTVVLDASGVPHPQRRSRAWHRNALLLGSASALGLAGVLWRLLAAPQPLDLQRLVMFPLVVSGGEEQDTILAENVTDALREALVSTRYVRVVDGWPLLDERQRTNRRTLSTEQAKAIGRRQHSGYYIAGRIFRGDSVRLFLQLQDLVADSGVSRELVFGPAVGAWSTGVQAARELLPLLIPAGREGDLTSLGNLSPAATASFLQGERAYRRGRFKEALEHYRNAVRADSTFALAGLKGAQAASWDGRMTEAKQLILVARGHDAALAPRYAHFARGFEAYLDFQGDSAVQEFRKALQLDPEWAEAWAGLAEVYTHLLPSDSPLDSLAQAAFAEAHRLDPTFAAVFYHLLEIAARKGDASGAARLMEQFRTAQPDSAQMVSAELMLECVNRGPGAVRWRAATLRSPRFVTEAARALAVGGLRQPDCAKAGWDAILTYDTTPPPSQISFRWGALFGLQSVLLAQGRYREVERLLEQDTVFNATLRDELYILDALAGADAAIDSRAAAAADRLRHASASAPKEMNSRDLWHLGIWEAQRGGAAEARAIADTLAARAAQSADREETLLAQSVAARAALARGDSAGALKLLQELVPTTGRGALIWNPWESLGGERLLLAQLRLAHGEFAEAIRIARNFDAPAPVPYVLYLPASLTLRLRAALALGDERLAQRIRARLLALGRRDLAADVP
jgi:Flp pilus assembly protein TadD